MIRLGEPEETPQQVAAAVRLAESKTTDLLRSTLVQPVEKVRILEATPLSRSVAESATLLMAETEGALTPPNVHTRIHLVAQWDLSADALPEESEEIPMGSAQENILEARLEEPEAQPCRLEKVIREERPETCVQLQPQLDTEAYFAAVLEFVLEFVYILPAFVAGGCSALVARGLLDVCRC